MAEKEGDADDGVGTGGAPRTDVDPETDTAALVQQQTPHAAAVVSEGGEPKVVGRRWQVLKQKLGEGNYGKVYQGKDLQTGMTIAVKVTNMRSLSKELQVRLKAETEILAKVSHPNIVQLYDQLQNGKYQLLMLEHLRGRDLDRAMVRGKPMPVGVVRLLFGDLCSGLKEMHRLNIVHRDLKPHNLLLSHTELGLAVLKIADFGFARYLGSADDMAKTVAGSPLYMAPEVLEAALGSAAKGYSSNVDLFSCGVILYQMLQGEPPYTAMTQPELLQKMRLGKRKPIMLNQNALVSAASQDPKGYVYPPPDTTTNWDALCGKSVRTLLDMLLLADPARRIDSLSFFDDPWVLSCEGARPARAARGAAAAAAVVTLALSVQLSSTADHKASQTWVVVKEQLGAAQLLSDVAIRLSGGASPSSAGGGGGSGGLSASLAQSSMLQPQQQDAAAPAACGPTRDAVQAASLFNRAAELCSAAWRSLLAERAGLLSLVPAEWQGTREYCQSLFFSCTASVAELLADAAQDERVDSAEAILFTHAKELSLRATVEEIIHNDGAATGLYRYAQSLLRVVSSETTSQLSAAQRKVALRCAEMLSKRIKKTAPGTTGFGSQM